MATLTSNSAPPSRIENAVERELARRRRLLRLYLFLLLIPLGLAAWFLLVGRSDHALLRKTVDDRVAPVEERYKQIAPKLQQVERLDKALPVVEKAADQLQAQEKQVEILRQQVQNLTPALLRGTDSSAEIRKLSAQLATIERNLAGYQQLSAQLARQEQRLAVMEREQRQVITDLKEVQVKVEKQPGPMPGFNVLDLRKLNDRVRALEEGTGDLRKDVFRLQGDIKDQKPPG
jgi:DNA repair exonuclease SbcCD ATPase subunit